MRKNHYIDRRGTMCMRKIHKINTRGTMCIVHAQNSLVDTCRLSMEMFGQMVIRKNSANSVDHFFSNCCAVRLNFEPDSGFK